MRLAYFFLLEQRHQVLTRQVLNDGHVKILFFEELFKLIDVLAVDQSQDLSLFHY
jgi:hypothetical protein